jgi:SAM-dependent methyltransferase
MTTPGLLADVYRARFDGKVAYRRKVWSSLVENLFVPRLGDAKRVLDLAAGYGDFINNVAADEKFAIDLNPDARVHLDADVHLFAIDATTPWPIAEGSLDAVFTSNFFEHLPSPDALLGVLSQASRSLKPGGRLIAIGPNMRYTLKEYWDFLDHRLPLTERSLKEALELRGFRVVECIPRLLPYSMDSHRQVPASLVALYCRVPLLWRFFGKQFLLVAERL